MKRLSLTFCLVTCAFLSVRADVTLPDVIGNSMVLQQKQAISIWGKAEPGEAVSVSFGRIRRTAVADANGKWIVDLGKFSADSSPREMTIAGKSTIVLKDILVGEVWLVSGQSNMQRLLRETSDGAAVETAANHPNIRLFNVSREVAFKRRAGKLGEWAACTPESVKEFSAAGYYFGVDLEKELKVPIGLINSSYGGSQAEAWTPEEYLLANPDLKVTVERTKIWDAERPRVRVEYPEAIKKWREDAERQRAAGVRPSPSPSVPDALREYRIAASIYKGMIEPLIPFAIKGAIWYQGESNEARAEQYNILLPTMIRSWRERWGTGNFPFGIVQLPNFHPVKNEPEESAWSFLRDAQRRTAVTTPNTGLIVTIDIGEANDGHPKNKLDVGRRMSRWALRQAYGRKLSDSPVLQKADAKGEKMILTFDNAGTGLKVGKGDTLSEFAIAGSDKKWVWADARIVGKNKIEVWSPQVLKPVAVRYAFNSNPKQPNLTNESGLPAGPFRTDSWPDATTGKR